MGFAPRGIDISFVVSTVNKHTTSLVYTLDAFSVQNEDGFLFPPVVEGPMLFSPVWVEEVVSVSYVLIARQS